MYSILFTPSLFYLTNVVGHFKPQLQRAFPGSWVGYISCDKQKKHNDKWYWLDKIMSLYSLFNLTVICYYCYKQKGYINKLFSWYYAKFNVVIVELNKCDDNYQWRTKQRVLLFTLITKRAATIFQHAICCQTQSTGLALDDRLHRLVNCSLKMSYMQCHCNVWPSGNMVYGLVKLLQSIHPKKGGVG